MGLERDARHDADDMTFSVTSSLIDAQTPANDDADQHRDAHAHLRETAQVTSHGRVVSCSVHERPVSVRGESGHARAMVAAMTRAREAEREELEEKEDKRRMAR